MSALLQMIAGVVFVASGAVLTVWGGHFLLTGYDVFKKQQARKIELEGQFWRADAHPPPSVVPETNRMIGLMMEGERNNVLEANCLESNLTDNVSLKKSLFAQGQQEMVVAVLDDSITNLDFHGRPVRQRNDYNFSFMLHSVRNDLDNYEVKLEITDGTHTIPQTIDFSKSVPHLVHGPSGVKVYRPFVSWPFTQIPQQITGSITIRALSHMVHGSVVVTFPSIEEGLFPSSPIVCGQRRGKETLSYDGEDHSYLAEQGTISMTVQTLWQPSYLTPGIDPHFFFWESADQAEGIYLNADADAHGRFTVEIQKAGERFKLGSDVIPIQGEEYTLVVRFNQEGLQLVVNNRNVAELQGDFISNFDRLGSQFFVGSTPNSDGTEAFSVIRNLKIFKVWVPDNDLESATGDYIPSE